MTLGETMLTIATGPFPDGNRFQGWSIGNDGRTVTLTRDPGAGPDELQAEYRINEAIRQAPALGRVAGVGVTDRFHLVSWLPTVPGMNDFSDETFRGLPVADIELVQTGDNGDTPATQVMTHLNRQELPVSLDPYTYFHDILTHGPGAKSTHRTSFEAFRALFASAPEMVRDYHPDTELAYLRALAHGFDRSTGLIIPLVSGERPSGYYYLLGATLTAIAQRCPEEVLERVKQKLSRLGVGEPVLAHHDYNDMPRFRVPWEADKLPGHYERVKERLFKV